MVGAADPFGRLLDEHEDFLEKLAEFEATLDEMMGTREASDANRALLDETIRFLEDELLPHFRREEEIVLPAMEERIGLYGSLVNVVAYEHAEIRREIDKIKEARADLDGPSGPWGAIQELNRHGIFTIQFLADHFRKERTSLFSTARVELPREALEAIRTRLGSP